MSDFHLPVPTDVGERILQLSLFELITPGDCAYSQAIELYDVIPKYVWYRRKRDFLKSNVTITRHFRSHGYDYMLNIHGAILKQDNGDAYIFYPGAREELVEDALRKITVSNARTAYDSVGGFCHFTIYELQQELKINGHCFSYNEIKEALFILHQTRIELASGGKKITSGYLLPSLTLVSEEDLHTDHNAKCLVRFHEIVSQSIQRLDFRQFNYRMAMSFRSSLTRAIFKRLSQRWKGASMSSDYGPVGLLTLFSGAGVDVDKKMSNNRRKMSQALNELVEKGVLSDYREKLLRTGRKIVDVHYTLLAGGRYVDQPARNFVSDTKRANHFANHNQLANTA